MASTQILNNIPPNKEHPEQEQNFLSSRMRLRNCMPSNSSAGSAVVSEKVIQKQDVLLCTRNTAFRNAVF